MYQGLDNFYMQQYKQQCYEVTKENDHVGGWMDDSLIDGRLR
jgi:hypothetical protein